MDFEEILEEVGSFGKYQKRLSFLYLVVAALLVPMYCLTTIFMVSILILNSENEVKLLLVLQVSSPRHWCKVSELSNLSFDQQIQLISPSVDENGVTKPDSCNMYDIDYSHLARVTNISVYMSDKNLTQLQVKPCDNGWAFDNNYYDETAVTAVRYLQYSSIFLP